MARFAQNTDVPCDRSENEIKRIVQRYGAWEFISAWRADRAMIGFRYHDRAIRFLLPLPDRSDDAFCKTPTGKDRNIRAIQDSWERACRQRWRALALVIKAKLEAVESGITTFEEEFLAHIIMPGGETIGECLTPRLEELKSSRALLALLPAPESKT
jgi:hypothetical protein